LYGRETKLGDELASEIFHVALFRPYLQSFFFGSFKILLLTNIGHEAYHRISFLDEPCHCREVSTWTLAKDCSEGIRSGIVTRGKRTTYECSWYQGHQNMPNKPFACRPYCASEREECFLRELSLRRVSIGPQVGFSLGGIGFAEMCQLKFAAGGLLQTYAGLQQKKTSRSRYEEDFLNWGFRFLRAFI
jgi:hypothetical protein